MRGLKENLFMRAGIKKIHQENIRSSPGQWQKNIPEVIACRVGFYRIIHLKDCAPERNGVIFSWYKFQSFIDCS